MNNVPFKWSRKYRNYQLQAQETLGELIFTSGKPFILGETPVKRDISVWNKAETLIYNTGNMYNIEKSAGGKQVCSELFYSLKCLAHI